MAKTLKQMPMPRGGESRPDFMLRCMNSPESIDEHASDTERSAACALLYENHGGSMVDTSADGEPIQMAANIRTKEVPAPDDDENCSAFFARCLVDATMTADYPDLTARALACAGLWDACDDDDNGGDYAGGGNGGMQMAARRRPRGDPRPNSKTGSKGRHSVRLLRGSR